MKNILKLSAFLILISSVANAQVSTNLNTSPTVTDSNYFLDASGFEGFPSQSEGRGLGFPRTNLTAFTFNTSTIDNLQIVSDFDGMVVYNSATGNTVSGQGVVTAVTPGFYYFSNPGNPGNITNGQWKPLGGGSSSEDIKTTETVTASKVNGAQVYGIKGSFTADGISAAVTIAVPSGMTGFYKITIFKGSTTNIVGTSVRQFGLSGTGNVITGAGIITEVYPSGTYDYVLEYFK
ncbi:hypothetical protein [uncultured Flavobacterium sp.]|uniref:hypothetical protein n=1 Tax=uncultured Flavobacterium sp. TaxID=165435 RepID=UPI0025E6F120|nr:hypothetical protein [uncultured Flavobacterium sp.]